jgi:hypothetical protein
MLASRTCPRYCASTLLDTFLRHLDLEGTEITDNSIPYLKGLSNLKWIGLAATHVTDQGVAELQETLRDCEINTQGQ